LPAPFAVAHDRQFLSRRGIDLDAGVGEHVAPGVVAERGVAQAH
jgi:hypothetical protein